MSFCPDIARPYQTLAASHRKEIFMNTSHSSAYKTGKTIGKLLAGGKKIGTLAVILGIAAAGISAMTHNAQRGGIPSYTQQSSSSQNKSSQRRSTRDSDGDSDFAIPAFLQNNPPTFKQDRFGTTDYAGYLQDCDDWNNKLSDYAHEQCLAGHKHWYAGFIAYLKQKGKYMDYYNAVNADKSKYNVEVQALGMENNENRY